MYIVLHAEGGYVCASEIYESYDDAYKVAKRLSGKMRQDFPRHYWESNNGARYVQILSREIIKKGETVESLYIDN
jgi:hypothetical protein